MCVRFWRVGGVIKTDNQTEHNLVLDLAACLGPMPCSKRIRDVLPN